MTNSTSTNSFFRRSVWARHIAVYITIFALVFQTTAGAVAATLSSATIASNLQSNPLFKEAPNHDRYQYITNDYMEASAPAAMSLGSFYARLESDYRDNLGEPTFVPILMGDITTFIPVYEKPRFVGSPLVQSRYIRYQIQSLLGRNLIDAEQEDGAYADEAAQIETLYKNALNYLMHENSEAIYGENLGQTLGLQQDGAAIDKNMVWPEFRVINGEKVVVPIVYLTQNTVDTRRVTDHEVFFGGVTSFTDLTITDVNVRLGRDAFLQVAGDLQNNSGTLSGSGELQIVVDGHLENLSGIIQAEGDLTIGAHSINSQTIVHRYDFGQENSGYFGQVAEINSTSGDVILRSHGDLLLQGGVVSAGEGITLAADGNIYVGPVQYLEQTTETERGWSTQRTQTQILQSRLTAEQTLELIANGSIVIDAAELVSDEGHIEILAGLGITVEDELTEYRSYMTGTFGNRTVTESVYQTVAIRSLLDAGKGVRLHTEFGDVTLRASEITSVEGTQVRATNGGVNLLMTTETDHYSYSSIEEGLFTVSTENRGHEIETGVPNTIVGGLAVEALNGITVQYEGDPDLSFDEQVDTLAQMPGLEWMAEVRASNPDVDWQAVELKYQEWNESSTSLSPAAMAIIAIAVAIAAGPAVSSLYGGAAATATAAAVPAAIGGSTALGAAAVAATTSLISAAALASINAAVNGEGLDGIHEAAFEAITDSDTLRSAAIAAVTAGVLSAVDAEFFDAEKYASDSAMVNTTTVVDAVTGLERTVSTLSLTGQAVQAVTHAAAQAGIRSVLAGEEFEDLFVHSLVQQGVNRLGQELATEIGEYAHSDSGVTALALVAHAGSSCFTGSLSAALTDGNVEDTCASAAAGAVIGEMVGIAISSDIPEAVDQDAKDGLIGKDWNSYLARANQLIAQGYDMSRLSAAFGAFLAGLDSDEAAKQAGIAYLFNSASEVEKETYHTWQRSDGARVFSQFPPTSIERESGVSDEKRIEGNPDTGYVEIDPKLEQERIAQAEFENAQARADYEARIREALLECIDTSYSGSNCGRFLFNASGTNGPTDVYLSEEYERTPGQDALQAQLAMIRSGAALAQEVGSGIILVGCEAIDLCTFATATDDLVDGEIGVGQYFATVGLIVATSGGKGRIAEEMGDYSNGLLRRGFQPRYWNHEIDFQGNRVFQRDDLIDPDLTDAIGRTNLERMQSGLAPYGPDGKSINLHHLTQRHDGAIAEVAETMHTENSSILHINPSSVPSGIDREAFDRWRRDYWRSRANDFDPDFDG